MSRRWVEAGGDHQVPFLKAAARVLKGATVACPKCGHEPLRRYFHAFRPEAGTGTLWVWCPACSTTTHLPRVTPTAPMPPDPFAHLSLREFADLELGGGSSLLDRLDQLWEHPPAPETSGGGAPATRPE